MLFIMRTTIVVSIMPTITAGNAAQDAWASSLVAWVGSMAVAAAIGALGTKFPDLTLIGYAQQLIGGVPARVLSLIYLWALLWVAAVDLRIYSEVLVTAFFPETPLMVLAAAMALVSSYAAFAGIEAIGRSSDFILPAFAGALIASLIVAAPHVRICRLEPVLARGLKPVLVGSITPMTITLQVPAIAFVGPSVLRPRQMIRTVVWALTASHLLLLAASVVVVGVLGAEPAARSVFPLFRMIRAVRASEFLERFEALVVLPWGLGMFVGLSTSLYCLAKGASEVFGLTDYRPLLGPLVVICLTLCINSFDNMAQLSAFFRPEIAGPYAFLLMLSPPAVLWPAYYLRKLRSGRTRASRGERR